MSEEEKIKDIIEIIELSKEEIENNQDVTAVLDLQDLKSLKNLLDLYNKEKEKNKLQEKTLVEFVEEREKLLKTPVISKDKIREFIKEELPDDEIMECCECFDINGIFIRKKLEELLEE